MNVSDHLRGVVITQSFLPEILHAYDNQRLHLAAMPEDTETYYPFPSMLGAQIETAQRLYKSRDMPQIEYVGKTALELESPLCRAILPSPVILGANEVGHIAEGLIRLSVGYWIVASRLKDTSIERVGAEIRALRKANLAIALWQSYAKSTYEPQSLPEKLNPNAHLKKSKGMR